VAHGDYEKLTPEAIGELWVRLRSGKAARPAAPVPAPPARLPHPHPGRPRRHRPRAQPTPPANPRLQDTITSTSRGVALTA
jgi:hypothetical protein